jgi:lysozyme family protein
MDQIDLLIQREGGSKIVNLPGDTGGVTKYGISSNNHPDVDVPNLTYQDARDIYINTYLVSSNIYKLDQPLQEQMLDFAVHSGTETAIKKLQTLLNVTPDGVIGPITLSKCNGYQLRDVNNALVKTRVHFLLNMNKPHVWRGWIRRASSFVR